MAIGSIKLQRRQHARRPVTMPAVSPVSNGADARCLRLVIGQSDIDRAMRAAESAWPEECCGLLIGRRDGDATVIAEIVATPNISTADRTRSFEIDPTLVLRFLRAGRTGGQPGNTGGIELVGFYHSHPDGTTTPSARDAATAWPGMSYLILACPSGQSVALSSHQWCPSASRWSVEAIAPPDGL